MCSSVSQSASQVALTEGNTAMPMRDLMYFRVHFKSRCDFLLMRRFELLLIKRYYLLFGLIQENVHVFIIRRLHLTKKAAVLAVRLVAY